MIRSKENLFANKSWFDFLPWNQRELCGEEEEGVSHDLSVNSAAVFLTQNKEEEKTEDGEEDTGFGLFSESLNEPEPLKYHSTPTGHSCCSGRNG